MVFLCSLLDKLIVMALLKVPIMSYFINLLNDPAFIQNARGGGYEALLLFCMIYKT